VYSQCIYLTVKNENPSPAQVMTTQSVVEMDRLVVSSSDCPCNRCNSPGFNPSILRHSGV
jgi:hypothetical protein